MTRLPNPGILRLMMPPVVWFDVTETLSSRMRTGIQRVTIELARELLRQNRVRLIRLDLKTRDFVALTAEEVSQLFSPVPPPSPSHGWLRWMTRRGLVPLLGFVKDGLLRLSLVVPRRSHFDWAGGIYLTTEVLGNLVRFETVKRLQRRVPTVLMLHDLLPLTTPAYSALRHRAFARHWALIVNATRVVSVSRHTQEEALRYAAQQGQTLPPLSVCYPGHTLGNLAEVAPLPPPPSRFFLCVGTLEHRKNQAGLLSAYLSYRHAGGTTGLVIVGRPGPGADLLVKDLEAASAQGVLWYNQADDHNLAWLYRRARAVVYPSRAEGFGLPLVEALALNTPCLTSYGTSTAEVAELCGGCLVVDPEDVTAIAASLAKLDDDSVHHQLMTTIKKDKIPTWSVFADGVSQRCPMRLLFDVSALGHGALGPQHRTGLYQVALAYLEELRQQPDVELGLYSSSGNRILANRFLKEAGWLHQVWVGNPVAAFLYFAASFLEFAVYRSPLKPLTPLFSGLKAVFEALRCRADAPSLKTWAAYLSPMEAIPQPVREAGLITALVIHDLIPLVLPQYPQDPSDPTRWFTKLWQTVKFTDLVFSVSEATRQDWLRLKPGFPAQRVLVAPNAVDPRRFHPGVSLEKTPFFLAVSTIEPRKRFDAVVAGYQAYRKEGGTTPLWIAGKDKAGRLTATEGVKLLGFVDEAALPGLFASCTAFLSLSEYEGFGLPILEAMACGAPVLVSNLTSHPEVAGQAGVYLDPDDTQAIAQALARMDNPDERKAWAQRSLVQARHFDWKTTVAAVVDRIRQEVDQ